MLTDLHVENFILIESLDVEFGPGLNVITGETGTGKSILMEAITLLGGGRGFGEQVRAGSEEAIIEGAFDVTGLVGVKELLAAKGLTVGEGTLVLSRRIQVKGPNRCRINGQLTTLGDLTEVGSSLMDIQSQGEHYSLLSPKEHLRILDAYAGAELAAIKGEYQELYAKYSRLQEELTKLSQSEAERARRIDMLKFQVEEIAAAGFQEGEDQELIERRNILRNAERLAEETSKAYGLIREGFGELPGALDSLHEAAASLEKICRIDSSWEETLTGYNALLSSLEEVADRLRSYLEELNYDNAELDQLESRLALAESLKRKYGPELADVLEYLAQAREELATLETSDLRRKELEAKIDQVATDLRELGLALRRRREEGAKRLEAAVQAGLAELRFTGARFTVKVEPLEGFHPDGMEEVEFFFSANPGEDLKPLNKVASGGELSRLLLTLKGALAASEGVPVLIFDEIDTGTSGRTAQAIAEKLYQLSRDYQVICVTHLPQIAAMGDRHILLEKEIDPQGQSTKVCVRILNEDERIAELARLLGGVAVSEATYQAARDLLKQAEGYKKPY
ncbi:MAG: DNA repair protein RecN [Firmicutes bacterium]|nr:DNA repair protein RecN [Bacillota bacterium]